MVEYIYLNVFLKVKVLKQTLLCLIFHIIKGYNIQEPLLHMRAGSDMFRRRAGWKYAKSQSELFKFMKDNGFIGNSQYIKSCVVRSGSSIAPNWIRKFVFRTLMRKS